MDVRDFDGLVVLVTGASTGLGRALAAGAAERGAKAVIVNYASSAGEADETAKQVRAAGAEAVVVQGDVAQDADCKAIVAAAEPYGRIDALFNNAGITRFATNHADLDKLSAEDFQAIYAVNVIGAFQMVRAARSLLAAAATTGAVVNTSSIAGVVGNGSSVAYAASKGALNTMTVSLARALAPKIRVNAVCPGFIDTPWFEKSSPGLGARLSEGVAASVPLRVASTAEDIAATALTLASPLSRHVTGETLLVDAGLHLGFASFSMR